MTRLRTTRRVTRAFLCAAVCAIAGCSDNNGSGRDGPAGEAFGDVDGAPVTPTFSDPTLDDVLAAPVESDSMAFDRRALQRELDRRYGPRDAEPVGIEDMHLPDAYTADAS